MDNLEYPEKTEFVRNELTGTCNTRGLLMDVTFGPGIRISHEA